MSSTHWHGLKKCNEDHPGACTGEWGCICKNCKDRQHPLDLQARMPQSEKDAFAAWSMRISRMEAAPNGKESA